jgi:hypothetical protein
MTGVACGVPHLLGRRCGKQNPAAETPLLRSRLQTSSLVIPGGCPILAARQVLHGVEATCIPDPMLLDNRCESEFKGFLFQFVLQ